jgi:hypothetical protein
MKSVDEITRFCWYLIFIDNHKSLGFLAENQVYISDLKPVIGFFYGKHRNGLMQIFCTFKQKNL